MKEKVFNLGVGGVVYNLKRENFDALVWRDPAYAEMDHLIIHAVENRIRVLGIPELARFCAGIAFKGTGSPYIPKNADRQTFEEVYGWFADTYVRTGKPSEDEIEAFAKFETERDIHEDGSWNFED